MRRAFADPSVEAQILQSRDRIGASKAIISMSRFVIDRSRDAIRASRVRLALEKPVIVDAVDPGGTRALLSRALLSHLDDEAIGQFVDDFATAYTEALATGDDEGADTIGTVLTILGRHLARQLGPRAAGVPMN